MTVRTWLFPELGRFERGARRRDAWRKAQRDVARHPAFWLTIAAILAVAVAVVLSLPSLGVPITARGTVRGVALVVTIAAAAAASWLFRRTIQRSLRRQLREDGVPVCEACGYDLSGASGDRCPECGFVYARR